MRRVGERTLWLGHVGDLLNPRPMLAEGIEAILELALNEPLAPLPRELLRLRIPLSDGGDNATWLVELAIESLTRLLRADVPTLVCCSAGMSRSVVIAAAGIARVEAVPFQEATLRITASGPADVSPRLLAQVNEALHRF